MNRPPGSEGGGPWRPAWGYALLALALLGGSGWLLLGLPDDTAMEAAAPTLPAAASATPPAVWPGAASAASLPAPALAVASAAAPPTAPQPSDDLAAHVPPGTVPTMNQVIERLHQAGVRTGLGAFNPPGTRPPLIGLAVPEGFVLPPGYVRHHQATDDGQRIEAILMFDPDHPPPEAAGRPLATPAERVVPAELAPPGLPIRLISLPPPADPGSPPR
ncbi:MAG: hypothetical protein IV094_08240 [Vitreoscilla sp.]|nr:hypothetical protein [Vitreoscilla sp.]